MEKFRRCSRCKLKKMLSDHDKGKYNSKYCPDCTVELVYEKFLNKE